MKPARITGLALLALVALGASSASALMGGLPASGTYTVLGKTATLETTNKEKVACGEVKGTGTIETDTRGSGTLDFLKCEALGFPIFSLGEKEPKELKEALVLMPGFATICLINSVQLIFGIFLELSEPVHAHVKALGILEVIEGSFIGEVVTAKPAKLFAAKIEGKEGKQNITECKDEAGNVKKASLKVKKNAEPALSASKTIVEDLVQFEKEEELMDK